MHLMFTLDANGHRIYTLKKVQAAEVTKSAHPARFSPDDKYSRYFTPAPVFPSPSTSAPLPPYFLPETFTDLLGGNIRHRVTLKKRYGLLITQQKNERVLGQ